MFQGVTTFFAGFQMLLSHASLRAVLWRMLGLLFVLMVALVIGVFYLADYLNSLWLPQGDAWYWQIVAWLAWALALFLSLISGVVSFTILASAAAAPWLDTLATRTENILGKSSLENADSWLSQSLAALVNSIRPLFGLLLMGVLALLFLLIPILGGFISTAIWAYAGIRFLNFELFDTQASRAGLAFKQRKNHFAKNRFFWFGFGGTSMLLMMVPFLNLLVIPAAVVALAKKG